MMDWIATDLDGTLFSRAWEGADAVPATWRACAGMGAGGGDGARGGAGAGEEPSSWAPAATWRLFRLLAREARVVPVTARDADSYARVRLEGVPMRGPAVLANGAVVLDEAGAVDAGWEARMLDLLATWEPVLGALLASLAELGAGRLRPRLVAGPGGRAAYLVAKADAAWWAGPEGRALVAAGAGRWAGCHAALLGAELQVVPPGVGKAHATAYVAGRYFGGRAPLLALGDMPTDLPFMRQAGLLAVPAGSVLDGALGGREDAPRAV